MSDSPLSMQKLRQVIRLYGQGKVTSPSTVCWAFRATRLKVFTGLPQFGYQL
jgi:hypothetical protein